MTIEMERSTKSRCPKIELPDIDLCVVYRNLLLSVALSETSLASLTDSEGVTIQRLIGNDESLPSELIRNNYITGNVMSGVASIEDTLVKILIETIDMLESDCEY
jgi:hypothetical protein